MLPAATQTAARADTHADDTLRHWQDTLARFLLHRATDDSELDRLLQKAPRNEAAKRVYRNNVMHSLTEALGEQFPAAQRLLGEGFFTGLAREFVLDYPPNEPALTFYGREFPRFVGAHARCRSLPWLADLTRLEYHCQLGRYAADEPELDLSELAAIAPQRLPGLRLRPLQSVHLMRSRWPVHKFREQALKADPQRVEAGAGEAFYVLVYRRRMRVRVLELAKLPFALLQSLAQGQSIGAAWQPLAAADNLPPRELTAVLGYLAGLRLFTTYTLEE